MIGIYVLKTVEEEPNQSEGVLVAAHRDVRDMLRDHSCARTPLRELPAEYFTFSGRFLLLRGSDLGGYISFWINLICSRISGGISSSRLAIALQIQRMMGFGSYETAHSMCHKIRAALIAPEEKLGGIVEVDETFIGGLAKNKHKDKRGLGLGTGGIGSGKFAVVGAVKRKGNVIARVIDNVRASTLEAFIQEAVSNKVSLLCTDEWVGYKHLGKKYPHEVIRHAKEQYVVGAVHTQTIEGFWSLIKRGCVGTFHKVSKKYLPLYVAEFAFRYNNRQNPDIFGSAIAGC